MASASLENTAPEANKREAHSFTQDSDSSKQPCFAPSLGILSVGGKQLSAVNGMTSVHARGEGKRMRGESLEEDYATSLDRGLAVLLKPDSEKDADKPKNRLQGRLSEENLDDEDYAAALERGLAVMLKSEADNDTDALKVIIDNSENEQRVAGEATSLEHNSVEMETSNPAVANPLTQKDDVGYRKVTRSSMYSIKDATPSPISISPAPDVAEAHKGGPRYENVPCTDVAGVDKVADVTASEGAKSVERSAASSEGLYCKARQGRRSSTPYSTVRERISSGSDSDSSIHLTVFPQSSSAGNGSGDDELDIEVSIASCWSSGSWSVPSDPLAHFGPVRVALMAVRGAPGNQVCADCNARG